MSTLTTHLRQRLVGTIRDQHLFAPGDTLIVGISGGADSTALLDLLAGLADFSLRLVAAHLNHCLRGAESDGDEAFARSLADRYGIPFESRRVAVQELAAHQGLNLEDAGRRARMAFFTELAATWQAAGIALAHHADDQAETVLMRLLRGAGPGGLGGMPYKNDRGVIRPLLDITRAEIEAYLAERGLAWREDASNRDTDFLRNRIRHELLPLLEGYNPAIRKRLGATAALLADENALLDQLATEAMTRSCTASDSGVSCDLGLLATQPAALRRRAFRLALKQLAGNLDHFTTRHIRALEELADAPRPNGTLDLPQGITATKAYGTLLLQRAPRVRRHKSGTAAPIPPPLTIPGPGAYPLPDGSRLTVEIIDAPTGRSRFATNTAIFDLDRAPFPWTVRTFRDGDRMVPLGMTGSKKVKELFMEARIPVPHRRQIPLVFSGDDLIWVCGLRTSHPARITEESTHLAAATVTPAVTPGGTVGSPGSRHLIVSADTGPIPVE